MTGISVNHSQQRPRRNSDDAFTFPPFLLLFQVVGHLQDHRYTMDISSGVLFQPSFPLMSRRPGLLDLPREVLRTIALHIYDPLELTQQDRLSEYKCLQALRTAWGIFSTVDMHQERQDALTSLIAFGMTCRKVRREVRVVQFRCIRTPTVQHLETVVQNRDTWGRYVK